MNLVICLGVDRGWVGFGEDCLTVGSPERIPGAIVIICANLM